MSSSSTKVRTRFAPSPTGFLHIGGIRTALYCYLFTRKMGGQFLLRIEDTDQKRYVAEAENYIAEALKWCGIEPDESPEKGGDFGPYRQSERKDLYQKYVQQLVDNGRAYYAFDTAEELEAMRERLKAAGSSNQQYGPDTRMKMTNALTLSAEEVAERLASDAPYVVRFKIPDNQVVKVNDLVRGMVSVASNLLDDKILLKGDGMPTYHLANVVDDHLMEITHVIRGEEWLPSTPLHVLLYRAFDWEETMPKFAHLPLIMKPTGKGKLSKRDGDKLGFPVFPLAWKKDDGETSSGFREMGFFPEAFANFLGFLGWNPGTEQEIFSLEGLIEAFSVERVSKSGAKFDFTKAKWFNEQHLKQKTDAELADAVLLIAPEGLENVDRSLLMEACGLMKERLTFTNDFWKVGRFFFEKPASYDAKVVRKKWKAERKPMFLDLKNQLSALPTADFTAEKVEALVKAFIEESGLGFGNVLQVFRVMVAGQVSGPPIFEVAALLGQAEIVDRMTVGAAAFDAMKAEVV